MIDTHAIASTVIDTHAIATTWEEFIAAWPGRVARIRELLASRQLPVVLEGGRRAGELLRELHDLARDRQLTDARVAEMIAELTRYQGGRL